MTPIQMIAAFLGITLVILSVHEYWKPEIGAILA